MKHRVERVQKLIRNELGKIMIRETEFGGALVTITEVETDKSLENARVKVSVWPSSRAEVVLKILRKETGRFHHLLFKKINLKPMPLIRFEIDRGLEHAAAVEKVLLKDNNK